MFFLQSMTSVVANRLFTICFSVTLYLTIKKKNSLSTPIVRLSVGWYRHERICNFSYYDWCVTLVIVFACWTHWWLLYAPISKPSGCFRHAINTNTNTNKAAKPALNRAAFDKASSTEYVSLRKWLWGKRRLTIFHYDNGGRPSRRSPLS